MIHPSQLINPKRSKNTLSAASSPPPPHIEEVSEPIKSTDYEPLIKDMPMFIPNPFTEEEFMELGNA
jgi:hypothetical protein